MLATRVSFQEPLNNRKKKLEDAQRYQEFLRDVEDEEAWIREKEPVVSSTNLGVYPLCFAVNSSQ